MQPYLGEKVVKSSHLLQGFFTLTVGCLALAGPVQAADFDPRGLEFFEKKVRPVLVEHCYKCHSPQSKRRPRGNLRLDSRAGLLKGGESGPAMVAGHPERSRFIQAIQYKEDLRMPPRSKLPEDTIADLVAWVKMGAPWPRDRGEPGLAREDGFDFEKRMRQWAFQPRKEVSPPPVQDTTWCRTSLDPFILARLEQAGLQPAAEADRRDWLRRVTYDLIGLPPTPGDIQAFLDDDSPDAYARVVDRLLASPAYGERWARHWLDLVRFAETRGHEFDFDIPEAYRYRDYIIRAFNTDLPYDQLVREHIAGDLIQPPRRHPVDGFNESILGTGFWFLGEGKHSPVDLRGDGADRRDNQIDVFSKTFLALTVSCARCHDHKFDPIYTRDYYSLVSYLQSGRMQRAFLDPPERWAQPSRRIRALQEQIRRVAVERSVRVLQTQGQDFRPGPKDTGAFLTAWRKLVSAGGDADTVRAQLLEHLQQQQHKAEEAEKRAVLFADFTGADYGEWDTTGYAFGSRPSQGGDLRVQADRAVPVQEVIPPGLAHGGLVSSRLQGTLRSPTFRISKKYILYRVASASSPGSKGQAVKIRLIIDGFQLIRNPIYGGLEITIKAGDRPRWFVQDVSMWPGLFAYIEVLDDGTGAVALDRVLFSDDRTPPPEAPNPLLLDVLQESTPANPATWDERFRQVLRETAQLWHQGQLQDRADYQDRLALLNEWLASEQVQGLAAEAGEAQILQNLLHEKEQIEAGLPEPLRGLGMAAGTLVEERIYIRGNPRNLGPPAPRQLLVALGGNEQAESQDSGRLELADHLLRSSADLVARVMVNRIWHYHFGQGIVRSPDNFGAQGEKPTHPALLDWLAGEFMRSGWSIKTMHRLIVLSATYRMASRGHVETEKLDPENKLLHRMPVRRLEAEAIRDALLAVSGQFDRRMYGRGSLPYLTPFMIGRGRPASGPLDGEGRRSLYLNVRRNFLNPMFLAFDYPTPLTTMGRRSVSNVPAQALTLLNNPFVLQQTRQWSQQVLRQPGQTPQERIRSLYLAAFARTPTQAELAEAQAFLDTQGREYGRPNDPRAWADLCHVLCNVKEFLFIR
jgi:hypothetical protein